MCSSGRDSKARCNHATGNCIALDTRKEWWPRRVRYAISPALLGVHTVSPVIRLRSPVTYTVESRESLGSRSPELFSYRGKVGKMSGTRVCLYRNTARKDSDMSTSRRVAKTTRHAGLQRTIR